MSGLKDSLLAGISVSAALASPAFAQAQQNETETVIVAGTRVQGMTAADSAAPITVLGTDALTQGIGPADLRQQLLASYRDLSLCALGPGHQAQVASTG